MSDTGFATEGDSLYAHLHSALDRDDCNSIVKLIVNKISPLSQEGGLLERSLVYEIRC